VPPVPLPSEEDILYPKYPVGYTDQILADWVCDVSNPSDFDWKPCNCSNTKVHRTPLYGKIFDDANDPRRLPFDVSLDYSLHSDGGFADPRTQNLYRNYQLCNQIHDCNFTCFKYCPRGSEQICRSLYPRDLETLMPFFRKQHPDVDDEAMLKVIAQESGFLRVTRDAKSRVRIGIMPPFNNAHLNAHMSDPLLFIAHHGNCDVKQIVNSNGMSQYVGSYISKSEKPEFRKISNIFLRKLNGLEAKLGAQASDLQV